MKTLEGIFIRPTEEQLSKIWAACALEGFPVDSTGVLQLLMLAVEPEDEPELEPADPLQDALARGMEYLKANPDKATVLKNAGSHLFGMLKNKFTPPKGTP